jgi:hypothetical protein
MPIQFVGDQREPAVRLPGESNIAASSTQFVTPDDDVRQLCFLLGVVRVQRHRFVVDLRPVAHLAQGIDKIFLLLQFRDADPVFRHVLPPSFPT